MSLSFVNLSADVYFVCVNHALSTEREEIVGLLVGEVDENRIAHVSAVVILRRSDKRKDRVEISPEQLSSASTEAEKLSFMLKKPVRIIGWYHSHPRLTVWPSPIDVSTQESYQMMDDGFIGIIFSVFNEDPSKKGGRVQMTCFQSQTVIEDGNVEKKRIDVPVYLVPATHISNVCMEALIKLPDQLCQEEQFAYQMTNQIELDYLTRLHNTSVYLRSMGQIAEVICGPLIKMLEERIINSDVKRKKLQRKEKDIRIISAQIRGEIRRKKRDAIRGTVEHNPERVEKAVQLLEENLVVDPIQLDNLITSDIPSAVTSEVYQENTDVSLSASPPMFCSPDELCISNTVETSGTDECFQAGLPSVTEEKAVSTQTSSEKDTSETDLPPDSPKLKNE